MNIYRRVMARYHRVKSEPQVSYLAAIHYRGCVVYLVASTIWAAVKEVQSEIRDDKTVSQATISTVGANELVWHWHRR